MKKIVYTMACALAFAGAAQAQTTIKEVRPEVTDLLVFNDEVRLYTYKQDEGQFLFTKQVKKEAEPAKDAILNKGVINTIVGRNAAGSELYVYHKLGRNKDVIATYAWDGSTFKQTGERRMPRLKNNSQNLGMYLTEDQEYLYLTAELGRSRGNEDLYVSRWQNNAWSKPANLGKEVNTRQSEFAPFVSGDSLYFSRQEDDAAYVYSVALQNRVTPIGEPVKMDESINEQNAFNAYFRKLDNTVAWVSAGGTELVEDVLAEEEDYSLADTASGSQEPGTIAEQPIATSLTLKYDLNQVYLNATEEQKLVEMVTALPTNSVVSVRAYSDGTGTEAAKASVSQKRAELLQTYIQKHFAAKQLQVTIDARVHDAKGENYRVAEIEVIK